MPTLRSLTAAALALSPLFAQDPPTTTAPPSAAPHVVIDTVGPDGWRIRLGPTNLGNLLASDAGQQLWRPRVAPLLSQWQELTGADGFATAQDRLLGHSGRVRIGLWPNHSSSSSTVVAVIDGDGRTDLDALAADLKQWLYQTMPGEWQQIEFAGQQVTVRRNESQEATAPWRHGDSLWFASAPLGELPTTLASLAYLAEGCTGKAPLPNTPALRITADLPALLEPDQARAPASEQKAMRALGVDSLGPLSFEIGTAGPHVRFELAEQFRSEDRGIFAGLFPASGKLSRMLAMQPPANTSWRAGWFDWSALHAAIEAAIVAWSDEPVAKLRKDIHDEIGIDLAADLFAHLGQEVLLTGYVPEPDVEQFTWTLVFRLRDEKAFGKGLFTMLQKVRPMVQREGTNDHDGVEVHRYGNFLAYDTWLAVGHGVLVLSGGRDGEEQVGKALDLAKTLPGDDAAMTLPPSFANLQRHLPPGCNGLGSGELGSLVTMNADSWVGFLGGMGMLPFDSIGPSDPEQREQLLQLLRAHQLDVLRSATGYAEHTWRWRLYW